MIVFVRTKQATETLAERLQARGLRAAAINGDLVQTQRNRAIGQLRSGELDILVATDVAARGLDVERISHVVNFDIPSDAESYVHRIGRTGRAGRSGEALLFVTARERHLLNAIERATRQPLSEMALPSVNDVNSRRLSKFADSITAALASPEVATFGRLLEQYARERDVPMAEVAAALAVLAQDGRSLLLPAEPVAESYVERAGNSGRDNRAGEGKPAQRPRRPSSGEPGARKPGSALAKYRIRVGRRHKVQPGSIVGALANEGGLTRGDFGHIDIKTDHSVIELPADLSAETFARLERTRISGQLISLSREPGSAPTTVQRKPRKHSG